MIEPVEIGATRLNPALRISAVNVHSEPSLLDDTRISGISSHQLPAQLCTEWLRTDAVNEPAMPVAPGMRNKAAEAVIISPQRR